MRRALQFKKRLDDFLAKPGEDLVAQGLADLSQGRVTDHSLLVLIAAPRLKRLGLEIPDRAVPQPYEHELYERLKERLGDAAHSYYNSLIRRIVSYARALEHEQSRNSRSAYAAKHRF